MATSDMTLLTRNDLDFIVDKTTGRIAWVVKASDGTHATVERGYTGVRDVTGLMTGITSGTVTCARDGSTVTYTFEDVKLAAASQTIAATTPANMAMFYPTTGVIATAVSQLNTSAVRAAITSGGILKFYNTSTTDVHNGTLTFTSNNVWGTTMPGVARGTGVVYL